MSGSASGTGRGSLEMGRRASGIAGLWLSAPQ